MLACLDPVALDLVAIRLMGFDERRIRKVSESMTDTVLRVTEVREPADVEVMEVTEGGFQPRRVPLDTLRTEDSFAAHSGWRGHVELRSP